MSELNRCSGLLTQTRSWCRVAASGMPFAQGWHAGIAGARVQRGRREAVRPASPGACEARECRRHYMRIAELLRCVRLSGGTRKLHKK